MQLHIAIISLAALGGGIKVGKGKPGRIPLYIMNDNSDYDRLRMICNSIKHFDETIEEAAKQHKTPVPITPAWITNAGLECTKGPQLTFFEIEEIFRNQAKDAENFSNIA